MSDIPQNAEQANATKQLELEQGQWLLDKIAHREGSTASTNAVVTLFGARTRFWKALAFGVRLIALGAVAVALIAVIR